MSEVTPLEAELRGMGEDDLAALYAATGDESVSSAVLAELERRERLARAAERRRQVAEEWYLAAYADYLAAEEECRGELVNRAGVEAGVPDGFALWSGPLDKALKWATEELIEWWRLHPRVTLTEYRRTRSKQEDAHAPVAILHVDEIPTISYLAVVRVCTPGPAGVAVETVTCEHVAYGHESERTALACARRIAARRGVETRQVPGQQDAAEPAGQPVSC